MSNKSHYISEISENKLKEAISHVDTVAIAVLQEADLVREPKNILIYDALIYARNTLRKFEKVEVCK